MMPDVRFQFCPRALGPQWYLPDDPLIAAERLMWSWNGFVVHFLADEPVGLKLCWVEAPEVEPRRSE